jgi:hypothetical protein
MTTLPLLAALASIFLNGVNIDGVRNQAFDKCKTVLIDERGDVRLDCPGYQVEAPAAPAPKPAAPAAAPAAAITKHYWLVTDQSEPGAAQYDLDLFLNGKWLRKLKSGEDQIVMEVTKLLQPGANKLLVAATKRLEGGRRSASATANVRVIVGEGEASAGSVTIDNPLVECKRTAAETDNINEEFTIQAR